jgi:hypothetical protein
MTTDVEKGDRVVTRKGAKFRGVVVVTYASLKGVPHAVVESDHPHFDGTEHVYPLAQLVLDPIEEARP